MADRKPVSQTQDDAPEGASAAVNYQPKAVEPFSLFTEFDIHLFASGKHFRLYEKFGSHVVTHQGITGTYFAVWAPNAKYVAVVGNFNYWSRGANPLFVRLDSSGIWEGWIPNVGNGEVYKYFIVSQSGEELEKGDPYALKWEEPPSTASVVWDTWYEWKDQEWMENRHAHNKLNAPVSVYEVHLGSWVRDPGNPERRLPVSEFADRLVEHVKQCGFTHVEFMPIMQHPYEPSWGYQITGYYAANTKYGSPQDLMQLFEKLHQNGIGVLLDWVPSHFPGDATGLYHFDGTHLFEHADPRQGYHPDWKSYIFNYGRNEVRSFLLSNAVFWLDRYHADGLRVDAVASMLYLDYSREEGQWVPNAYGGRENLEAISLFRELNEIIYREYPDTQTIAEESTAFPGVSRPVYTGGLGFGMKWMMGWMNDTLKYFEKDPAFRKYHQDQLTFSTVYAFSENFMLPLSHDEVVYGKKALVSKMPGDEWQRFANLRLLYTYMFTHPGTKLLFMGGEFGQTSEWNYQVSLDWHLLQYPPHQGMKAFVKQLNQLYRTEAALFDKSFSPEGFEWIDTQDSENSILIYSRKGNSPKDTLIIALNLTPVPRTNYRIGVPMQGMYTEIFNSDTIGFWGTGQYQNGTYMTDDKAWHGKAYSIGISLPPLAGVVLKVW
ncbi:1,4-alpha-glucan branching protein GlgB [Siphonobacter aquaeclarae]|uniref:1,4-alpha-glucan branching enzyme GlgB n=1 Tax=Siphonobacter aquaeclarae TaxID=563176 RepID=A0A1G9PP05_9BACT|nr:1,4-alpha-glucan branching protein GlgB [Siphonobacter aquaeclarae]SDM00454.1 1,4-alpha-glucan branching enzyme [Siphonobacter aquaeclarae]